MHFELLHFSLGCIGMVVVWLNELVFNVLLVQVRLDCGRSLIVKYIEHGLLCFQLLKQESVPAAHSCDVL